MRNKKRNLKDFSKSKMKNLHYRLAEDKSKNKF